MSFDASGTYTLPPGTAAVAGATASASDVNSRFSDIETALNAVAHPSFTQTWAATQSLSDSAAIRFGTGADWSMDFDATDLRLVGTAGDYIIRLPTTKVLRIQDSAGQNILRVFEANRGPSSGNAATISGTLQVEDGQITVAHTTSTSAIVLRAADATTAARVGFQAADEGDRWAIEADDSDETGSDAGTDFQIKSYGDDDVLDTPVAMKITRADRAVQFGGTQVKIGGGSGVLWQSGSGSPEGSVTAPVGSFYSRTDGSTGTSFYVKESGSGNTGWVAK